MSRRRSRAAAGDTGAAVVDFLGVLGLLLLLFLVVLQLGLVLHVRNVLVAAAQEGARHDANADVVVGEGKAITEAAIAQALSSKAAGQTVVSTPTLVDVGDGQSAVEVTVDASVPLVFVFPEIHLRVRGHALREGP
ncbi:MAG: pilus assembly protein [Actinobacteria bacterium]|nr:pilus assembly protein [Actinomycetota bacterium]MCA1721512.1 pilus assembly protein [Actinomycetota bacterium]